MPRVGDERVLRSVAATFSDVAEDVASPVDGDPPADDGRYEELGLLGRGGLGEVVEVFDRDLLRKVALKRPRDGHVDPATTRALVHEAQVTAQLEHPGIPSVHALGVDALERPYFTMERLSGATLADRLASGPMREAEALRVWLPVAWAIAFAHDQGVVHRDLKPSNVMIGDFGRVHVVDWGIALARGDVPAGSFSGTPAYAAPEQIAGGPVDARADVYALGALLFEMLAGRPPIVADAPEAALAAVSRGDVARLSRVARVAPALDAVVAKAMATHPDDRHPSALAFVREVEAYLDGAAVPSAHEAPLTRFGRLYFARTRGLRRFRWVDVDLWMGSSTALGMMIGLGIASWWTPSLLGWAVASGVVGVVLAVPPTWTLLRPDRPDDPSDPLRRP